MRPELTQQELNRLDLDGLVNAGRAALREGEYSRAARLFRESVRRAPLRQDLRELLAAAVEDSINSGHAPERAQPGPAPHSTLEAMRRHEDYAEPRPTAPARAQTSPQSSRPEPPPQYATQRLPQDEDREQPHPSVDLQSRRMPPQPSPLDWDAWDSPRATPAEPAEYRLSSSAAPLPVPEEPTVVSPPWESEAPRPRQPAAEFREARQPQPPRRAIDLDLAEPAPPRATAPARPSEPRPSSAVFAPRGGPAHASLFGPRTAPQATHPSADRFPREEEPHLQAARPRAAVMPAPAARPIARPVTRADRRRAENFSRRHQRGPLSALLWGGLVGIVLMGLAGGGFWLYARHQQNSAQRIERENAARSINIKERARAFMQRGEYAMAFEQLYQLPEGPDRAHALAGAFAEKAERSLQLDPPRREAALESYLEAVQHDPENLAYGVALGRVYYQLAREKPQDSAASRDYLALARKTFEAVVQRDPTLVEGWENLAKVAISLRDDTLQHRCYQQIMKVAPDSPAAQDARRALLSLGFKID